MPVIVRQLAMDIVAVILKWISNFMLLTRIVCHDDVFVAIMQNVEALQVNYSMGFDETLEHAVFK